MNATCTTWSILEGKLCISKCKPQMIYLSGIFLFSFFIVNMSQLLHILKFCPHLGLKIMIWTVYSVEHAKNYPKYTKIFMVWYKGEQVTFVFCKLLGYTEEYLYHSFCITIYVFTHLLISNHTYAVNGLDRSFGTKMWTKTDSMDGCGEEVMLVRLCPSHY